MLHLLSAMPHDLHISIRNDLPEGVTSVTDGRRNVWVRKGLTAVSEHCAIVHELVHIRYGHTEKQPWGIERRVREETARTLISVDDLHGAWLRSLSIPEMAEELSVTETVLNDRLHTLTHSESHTIRTRIQAALGTVGA